ncbi:MAG: terminase family protein [Candidatus Marinimicrobia bacterium]|nr:terminase family protein [Candidatus Neomarinimicrobiota bacterium]
MAKDENVTVYRPFPGPQTTFLQSTARNVLYGGARGPGKSFGLVWKSALTPVKWHYEYCKKEISEKEARLLYAEARKVYVVIDKIKIVYPEYRALLIRRLYPDLEKNLKTECEKLFSVYGADWHERDHCFVFQSGAKVYLQHCQDERALKSLLGLNMHFIGIDEANQFPAEWLARIAMNVRNASNPDIKAQFVTTSNPGDVGHFYLKTKFIDRCRPIPDGKPRYSKIFDLTYQPLKAAPPFIDEDGLSWQFIPGLVFDNPAILKNDPDYVRQLKQLPPDLRKMWLEGNWDCVSGMYFDMWSVIHHTIPDNDYLYGTHFSKKTHTFYRAFDYGTKAPFVCLFIVVDRNGDAVVFDEIVETGLSASQQAKKVNQYTAEKYNLGPDDFAVNIADPAFWAKESENLRGELYSPAEFYADEGIYLTPGNNDRKAGAKVVYESLVIPEEGPPRIRFSQNCKNCILHIPLLQSASLNAEDVNTKSFDHEYDALRYFAMLIMRQYTEESDEKKLGWLDRLLQRQSTEKYGANLWKVL